MKSLPPQGICTPLIFQYLFRSDEHQCIDRQIGQFPVCFNSASIRKNDAITIPVFRPHEFVDGIVPVMILPDLISNAVTDKES